MRFHGLPPELCVGAADLTPVKSCSVLAVCVCLACGRAGPSFFICDDGHVACGTCTVIGSSAPSSGWCPVCDRAVPLSPGGIPLNVFAKTLFQCKCGVEGTLAKLKSHLLTESSHLHSNSSTDRSVSNSRRDGTTDPLESRTPSMELIASGNGPGASNALYAVGTRKVDIHNIRSKLQAIIADMDGVAEPNSDHRTRNDTDFLVTEITALSKSVNDIMTWLMTREQQLDEMFRSIMRQCGVDPEQTVNRHTDGSDTSPINVQQELRIIEQKVLENNRRVIDELVAKHVQKELATVSAMLSNQIASSNTAFFWFDFDTLHQRHRIEGAFVESDWQYSIIAGICFGANIEIDQIDSESYLGFYAAPKQHIRTNAPWPLRRTVVLSVHNEDGNIVKSKFYSSFMFGRYSGGYSSPSKSNAAGYKDFVPVSSLRLKRCIIKGLLCVSVGVEPMEPSNQWMVSPELSPDLAEITGGQNS